MTKASILAMACATVCMGFQTGMGNSLDMPVQPRPASDYANDSSGSISAGYMSRYEYKNMAVAPKLNASGLFNLNGKMTMPLGSSLKQTFGAGYSEILDGKLSERDQFDAFWSAGKEILPNLTVGGGYEFVHGGLPGYLAKRMHKASHALSQSVNGYAHYDDPGHGYFGTASVQYGFYGQIGWRCDLQAGKRWNSGFSQSVDFALSAGLGASSSYWGSGIDGFDQFNIKFSAPIRFNMMDDRKGVRLEPFIQTVWGGNTRHQIRDYARERIIDRFQIVGGVNLIYNF